ncbi:MULTISPECIES: DUF1656 domain-containing protein [Halomonas]|uniref:DUF1656 domain-containing protein n=1 Tax=Halomonas binhaiensis TaxID=2562282 RepID=A0A5C1NK22_9GAMM|nr:MULTISPECIES: DUF1656 domain-containing protein [Halomonas]QEM82748.1 DUF1656 domain-containing protein [Halomonas binhaiensis]
MALKEYALGGIYYSPLLLYALVGLTATIIIRFLVHRLLGSRRLWYQAWVDASLFVLCTAATAWFGATATGAA